MIFNQGQQDGGGGAGGAKYLGPRLIGGARNLDKTSGHCATVKRVGGPVMYPGARPRISPALYLVSTKDTSWHPKLKDLNLLLWQNQPVYFLTEK